jgi:hypothetical protein
MKIRPLILGFIVVMAALVALILWHGKKQSVGMPAASSVGTNVAPPPVASAPVGTPVHTSAPMTSAASPPVTPKPPAENKAQRMAEILSSANDVPIVFYGRLEDQFGNPVAGAEVAGTTTIINGTTTGANRISTTSDANGVFQLNAGNGQSLGIMPRKAGYALATTGTEFNYSHLSEGYYLPDPNNPTVIKMWKLQGAEPLVGIDQQYKLHVTAAPMNFDLLTGQIVPIGGDLKITVNRPPGVVSLRDRQDWSVLVEVVDGGLIETSVGDARVAYAAPDSGYQPSDTFLFSTNAPHRWFGGFDQMFFISSRNGQIYGKVLLSFNINRNADDPASLTFHGVANANHSRNLEGDADTAQSAGQ